MNGASRIGWPQLGPVRWAWGLSVGLLLALAGCGDGGNNGGGPAGMAVPVVYEEVEADLLRESLSLVGTLVGDEAVDVSFNRDGRVIELYFTEGDTVEKGELLAALDVRVLTAVVRQAEAAQVLAEADFQRAKQLFEQRAIAEQELDQMRASFETAEADLARVREELADARLVAPFGGVLGRRLVSPGRFVGAGEPLTRLVDMDPLKLEFAVPERYLSILSLGQEVNLTVSAWPEETFAGRISFIGPEVDPLNRTVSVVARVANTANQLRPGMFVRVNLLVAERPDALLVAESALLVRGDEEYVFVIDDEDKAAIRSIQSGVRRDGRVEVVEGLNKGDRVVVEGVQKIGPGSSLQPSLVPARDPGRGDAKGSSPDHGRGSEVKTD